MTLALLLAVPLAACAACAVARRRAVLEAINVAAFGLTFLLALAVASQVLRSGAISLFNGFLYADAPWPGGARCWKPSMSPPSASPFCWLSRWRLKCCAPAPSPCLTVFSTPMRRGPAARGVGSHQCRRLRPHLSAGSRGGVSSAALRRHLPV